MERGVKEAIRVKLEKTLLCRLLNYLLPVCNALIYCLCQQSKLSHLHTESRDLSQFDPADREEAPRAKLGQRPF